MRPKLLLRIASGLIIFHLMGHSFGHANWKQATDPEKQTIINQMIGPKFLFMGTERSMGDYYNGYGYCASIALLFFAFMLWLISNSVNKTKELSLKIMIAISICLFLWSIDEFIFFFPFAAGITLLAGICTLISIIQLRKQV